MARRSQKRNSSCKNARCAMKLDGRLKLGKQGVYLVRGGKKLKTFQLVPWEQIVAALHSSGLGST